MNTGKIFEENFKKSVPIDTYYLRLHDSSVGFDIENSTQRFALQSPYDCILYRACKMYCLELKSIKEKSISYDGASPKIKKHQIDELVKASKYGCEAGLILNFRGSGTTYYLSIEMFINLVSGMDKKSINEKEVASCSMIIPSRKLKVNYRYDLSVLVGGYKL